MKSGLLRVGFAIFVISAPLRAGLAQSLPAAAPEAVGLSSKRLADLRKTLADDVEKGKLPGAVIAVARKGRLAYFETVGFQDKPAGRPMAKNAIFRIYSMTKPWTSVAAMMLVEDGRIQLTDPVSKYLPAFKDLKMSAATKDAATGETSYALVAADREPTVQDLLRHTSGIAYDFVTRNAPVKEAYKQAGLEALGSDIRDKMTAAEFTEKLAKMPLAHQPGTAWEYSLSTALLGRVIEQVSGERLSKFLDERLFKPLKMTDSSFSIAKDKADRIAQPLLPYQLITIFDPTVPAANDLGGEGGLSTASDYLRFAQMLLNGGQLDGVRVLARPTIVLMTSDHLGSRPSSVVSPGELLLGTPGYTFGLGFMVRSGPGIAAVPGSEGEFMWGGAAGTFFWVDPKEQLAAVFMSQGPFATRAAYRRLVKDFVYAAIAD
ncbi:MAG TPA: serine hydrolase domain-containing protein [Hyphomicrobiales bacterium]|nr:serine hydrolase domain-containing protein [Hyphomicrobiales bacterium]